jgi:flavorubredoxin
VVSEAFKYSHIVFASTTYNNGIFVTMENLLHDIAAHNLQNRKVAIIENGSWAPVCSKLMTEILSKLKNVEIIENKVSIKSALKSDKYTELANLAQEIVKSMD